MTTHPLADLSTDSETDDVSIYDDAIDDLLARRPRLLGLAYRMLGDGASLLAWAVIEFGFRRRVLGRAVGLGIASHLVLDLLTHAHDIVLWPGRVSPRLGLGLYDAAPFAAFLVELAYGVACWRVFRGGRGLLALVVLGNLANLSLLSVGVPGPEVFLAGRPLMVVSLVAAQIVVTLLLTGWLARRPAVTALRRAVPSGVGVAVDA
jgi:hypothetical protein